MPCLAIAVLLCMRDCHLAWPWLVYRSLSQARSGSVEALQQQQPRPSNPHRKRKHLTCPCVQDRLIPSTPTWLQVQCCSGSSLDTLQRLGVTCIGTLITLKLALVATGALFYPVWGPLIQAFQRTQAIKQRGRRAFRHHAALQLHSL